MVSGSLILFFNLLTAFYSKTTRRIFVNFFQGLGENTCLLQHELKTTAHGL